LIIGTSAGQKNLIGKMDHPIPADIKTSSFFLFFRNPLSKFALLVGKMGE
jgi:hypothetical protein